MIRNSTDWTPELQEEILQDCYPDVDTMTREELVEALARETYDSQRAGDTVSKLAYHFTFGMLSKPNYSAETIIQVNEEHTRDIRYEADNAVEEGLYVILEWDDDDKRWKTTWDDTVYTDLSEAIDVFSDGVGTGSSLELFELKVAGYVEDSE